MSTTTRPLTEAAMLSGLKDAAQKLGYLVYHTTYSIGSDRGYPDLTIVGHGHIWFLEIKGPRGVISDDQKTWIGAIMDAGYDARFIWPHHYDEILDELRDVAEKGWYW